MTKLQDFTKTPEFKAAQNAINQLIYDQMQGKRKEVKVADLPEWKASEAKFNSQQWAE